MPSRYILLLLLLCMACKKEITPLSVPPDAQISFYNASDALKNALLQPRTVVRGFVLVDTPNVGYHINQDQPITVGLYPCFYGGDYAIPELKGTWFGFRRMPEGPHTLYLQDTAQAFLDTVATTLDKQIPTTVFYVDNLGVFSHLVLADNFQPQDDKTGFRIVDLSPTINQLTITINGHSVDALPSTIGYLQHTDFIPLDMPKDSVLNVHAFFANDPQDIIGATSLHVYPGHAYTLLFTGYTSDHPYVYTDPRTQRNVYPQTTFSIKGLQNF